jgi:endonuclease/exonuclease/phosphatase family metal-dependent hydrolase
MGRLGPWVRIDYIFHDASFAAVAAKRVADTVGAGHYPVQAELIFTGHGEPGAACR